jgi:hypothetical protein
LVILLEWNKVKVDCDTLDASTLKEQVHLDDVYPEED